MFGLIGTIIVCATFIWFAHTYLTPYIPPVPEEQMQVDADVEREVVNLDNVIAEIYNRLDEVN